MGVNCSCETPKHETTEMSLEIPKEKEKELCNKFLIKS